MIGLTITLVTLGYFVNRCMTDARQEAACKL